MKKSVFVVHCIDTEGPLLEDPNVPFEMIKRVFDLDIEPTRENLEKLRNATMDLGGVEESIKNLVDPQKMALGTWTEIDRMLAEIMSKEYRMILPDSRGEGWKFTWCCLNHTGFKGKNPRHRDAGYGNVYRHYKGLVNGQDFGDIIGFHYHPVSLHGDYNDSGTAYWGGENLNQILAHHIIDDGWFPSVFRPGFNTERPDSNWFLEQWIPFDYANMSVNRSVSNQPDLVGGRFGDWQSAIKQWRPYHPSHDDYQKEGNCRRWIARVLNMYARTAQIEIDDVRQAFREAKETGKAILAFADHDYKDMKFDIERVREMIKLVSSEHPDVEFEYRDGISAMQDYCNIEKRKCGLKAEIDEKGTFPVLRVEADEVFGPQPFLALKTLSGEYYWDNFDFVGSNKWSYTFDTNTLPYESLDIVAIAANSMSGLSEVKICKDK